MKTYDAIGIGVPKVLLPNASVDLTKWAVVACDQYTSEPEYWAQVEALVGDAPSTLHCIFPEVYLNAPGGDERITKINAAMKDYLANDVLEARESFLYVERVAANKTRRGLMVAMDLDAYDYTAGSNSLVRATEGTIVDRLPPRIRVREGAPIELPHIMVLIDDPEDTVIGPLAGASLEKVYDFDLMMKGGHLTGFAVSSEQEDRITAALARLAEPKRFAERYGLGDDAPVLLYAMGDGNHSLATAKAIWEKVKADAGPDDPRRYALVELVNVHDASLEFEPIHRVLFDVEDGFDVVGALSEYGGVEISSVDSLEAMTAAVDADAQSVGIIDASGYRVGRIKAPRGNLAVSTLQPFLSELEEAKRFGEVDYVHGTEATDRLGKKPNNLGFFLPGMDKSDLFKSVALDGALPRKTFSMGEADEKRFYMEARGLVR